MGSRSQVAIPGSSHLTLSSTLSSPSGYPEFITEVDSRPHQHSQHEPTLRVTVAAHRFEDLDVHLLTAASRARELVEMHRREDYDERAEMCPRDFRSDVGYFLPFAKSHYGLRHVSAEPAFDLIDSVFMAGFPRVDDAWAEAGLTGDTIVGTVVEIYPTFLKLWPKVTRPAYLCKGTLTAASFWALDCPLQPRNGPIRTKKKPLYDAASVLFWMGELNQGRPFPLSSHELAGIWGINQRTAWDRLNAVIEAGWARCIHCGSPGTDGTRDANVYQWTAPVLMYWPNIQSESSRGSDE